MSVHKKLMEARLRLQATELKKSGWNTYSEYKYFEMADFLPTIQTIFSELSLCGVVSCTPELAKLTITDFEDGTGLEITAPFGSAKLKASHEVQNIGACVTYQRRYLWMTALEIVEHDAVDASAGAEPEKKPEPKAKAEKMPTKEFVDHCTAMSDAVEAGIEALEAASDKAAAAAKKYGDKEASAGFKSKYEQALAMINQPMKEAA